MTWSSLAAAVIALALPSAASAAACCVGSTSPFPARVGECEHGVIGLSVGGEIAAGRWDRAGRLVGSTVHDEALIALLGGGVRIDRHWQLGAIVSARLSHRAGGELGGVGGGLGDVVVTALFDPLDEVFGGAPVPLFTMGLRLPTGRDWTESTTPLMEDVTGLPNPALLAGVQLERSLDKVPWNVAIDGSLGLSASGLVQPGVVVSGSAGAYFGTAWSLLGTASWSASWASADGAGAMVARPRLGARVVHGKRLAWRAWAGVDADLPVPWIGRSATRTLSATLGAALVR